MKEHFERLFEYEHWANLKVIDAIEETRFPNAKCMELLNHILAAQNNWLSRVRHEQTYMALWEMRDLFECIHLLTKVTQNWKQLIAQMDENEFHKQISYKTSLNETYTSSVAEIITHLINHSTYHRGQIVSELKGKIEKMPVTDYIAFMREKK
ncbi:DinB family protein [Pseudarcicella hirudinis]|nr:DinB family protein [Pseudarcicella hirudinis]